MHFNHPFPVFDYRYYEERLNLKKIIRNEDKIKRKGVLLGYHGEVEKGKVYFDYKSPVYIPYSKKLGSSMNVLTIGKIGAGKTVNGLNFMTQAFEHFGARTIILDPKAKLQKMKNPAPDKFTNLLSKSQEKPHGLPCTVITPNFLKKRAPYDVADIGWVISMKDIEAINDDALKFSLYYSIFGVKEGDAVDQAAERLFQKAYSYKPKNFLELKRQVGINVGSKMGEKSKMLNNLRNALNRGIIGESEEAMDIFSMAEDNIVIFTCSLARGDTSNMAYITSLISHLMDAQEQKNKGRKTMILVDEADILAPRYGHVMTKEPLQTLVTKKREVGMGLNLITQNPDRLDDAITEQIDYAICPKAGPKTSIAKFMNGIFGVSPNAFSHLRYGDKETYPKEWALISSSESERTNFFPKVPVCAF